MNREKVDEIYRQSVSDAIDEEFVDNQTQVWAWGEGRVKKYYHGIKICIIHQSSCIVIGTNRNYQ